MVDLKHFVLSAIFTLLLVCSFAQSFGKQENKRGSLLNSVLKENVSEAEMLKFVIRTEPTSEPCTRCCRRKRIVERQQENLESARNASRVACEELDASMVRLDEARAALRANFEQANILKRRIANRQNQLARLRVDLIDGGDTAEVRMDLRDKIQNVRAVLRRLRANQRSFEGERRDLVLEIDAAADSALFRSEDKQDASEALNRASRILDRQQSRLESCLNPPEVPDE